MLGGLWGAFVGGEGSGAAADMGPQGTGSWRCLLLRQPPCLRAR